MAHVLIAHQCQVNKHTAAPISRFVNSNSDLLNFVRMPLKHSLADIQLSTRNYYYYKNAKQRSIQINRALRVRGQ